MESECKASWERCTFTEKAWRFRLLCNLDVQSWKACGCFEKWIIILNFGYKAFNFVAFLSEEIKYFKWKKKCSNRIIIEIGCSLRHWRASLRAQLVKNLPAMQETLFNSWVGKIRWRRDRLPTPVFWGFPCGSTGKESACNEGGLGSIPGLGRSAGEGIGYPLQYSGASLVAQLVKNPPAMRETWVQSLGWEDLLEKGMITHSSILACRISWTV